MNTNIRLIFKHVSKKFDVVIVYTNLSSCKVSEIKINSYLCKLNGKAEKEHKG